MKTNKIKKVVITGCTGTIGVSLVNLLTSQEIECVLINIPEYVEKKKYNQINLIQFIDGSLDDYSKLKNESFLPRDCDAFVHLAWAGTFGPNRNNASLQLKNVYGTIDAIELAKEMGCKCFVGAGSQAEYGMGVQDTPHKVCPITGYGIAKFTAGELGKIKAKELGIRFNWVRIFSVIGPNLSKGSLVEYIVSSLLKGEEPKLTKCEQIWDFLYTKDAASAIQAVLEKGVDGKTYELGSGKTGTIRSFVETIPTILNKYIPLGFGAIEYPENQIMKMCADVSELYKDTLWEPKHSFKDAVLDIANSILEGN